MGKPHLLRKIKSIYLWLHRKSADTSRPRVGVSPLAIALFNEQLQIVGASCVYTMLSTAAADIPGQQQRQYEK